MYAYAFLLCLVDFLTTSGALPSDHPADQSWAEKRYEKMWQKDGGGKPDEQPSNVKPKGKRQTIPEKFLDGGRYLPENYFGDRGEVLISLHNAYPQKYDNDNLKVTYGVRIQTRLVLTVCSAVTYSPNKNFRVTYDNHYAESKPVTKVNPADITIHIMGVGNTDVFPIIEILIHPNLETSIFLADQYIYSQKAAVHTYKRCDNQYLVDLAIVATEIPLPGSRNVWIHTAENLLFRRSLDRVVAAHVVLGKCTVPVYQRDKRWGHDITGIGFANVNFQHWDGCKPMVCAYWAHSAQGPQDQKRCNNEYNGTRMCMKWHIPRSLCDLGMGTPVFCDVGNIHGLMGFILSETYYCNAIDLKIAIMQGVNDGIDWIRKTLSMRLSGDYEDTIPLWMQDLRANYTSGYIPRVKPKYLPTVPPPDPDKPSIGFNNFIGNQIYSVVNVYYKKGFRCRGTLVVYDLVVVPCSCVTASTYDIKLEGNIKTPHLVDFLGRAQDFTVSLTVNGSSPSVRVKTMEFHEKCDDHYMFDSAVMELEGELPVYRLAWVMTTQFNLYKTMLYLTSVSDAAMGNDCYWLNSDITSTFSVVTRLFKKSKIRFVPWTQCIEVVCPNEIWLSNHKDRCYGPLQPLNSSLYCFESTKKGFPACSIPHGTPIYCNVEQTRGFVGYVTTAVDVLFEEKCEIRESRNQMAVMVGIDQYMQTYADFLWISEVERRSRLLHKEGQSSCQLNLPPFVLIFAVSIVVLISFHEK